MPLVSRLSCSVSGARVALKGSKLGSEMNGVFLVEDGAPFFVGENPKPSLEGLGQVPFCLSVFDIY